MMSLESPSFDQNVIEQLKTTKEKVHHLMERYPATRSNDSYLVWLFMKMFEGLKMPWVEFEKFREFNVESITRMRRLIQSEGELPPNDPKVQEFREKKRVAMQHALGRRQV